MKATECLSKMIVAALRVGPNRRQLLQGAGVLAAGWAMPARVAGAQGGGPGRARTAAATGASVYERVGVRPLINARGTVTVVGATRLLPEVKAAMEAASREYVHLDELMEGVSRRLSELTGAEWGVVTSGASAALTLATAACIAGGDPDKLAQLPDLRGLRDEVIIPRYSRTAYDHAAKAVGVKMIEVSTREELAAALGPRTAMVMVLAGQSSQQGLLSLTEIEPLAASASVPILVDAAADELVVPNPYLSLGASMVAYSGGKCLRGPQCAGLLIGRKDLVQAAWINGAPHHGFGRGFKVGREEIMGMLAAVEAWMHSRNHAEEQRVWTGWLEHIATRVEQVRGVSARVTQPEGLSNRTPSLLVQWDSSVIPLTGEEMEQLLWDGDPRIAVSGMGSFLPFPPNTAPNIRITPYQLEAGEERVIADRVYAVLSNPPAPVRRTDLPAADVSGEWDVEMTFVSGSATQSFVFEQTGDALVGTHRASFAERHLEGTLHGREIVVRSSYTHQGVRLNFTFIGTVDGDRMQGTARLGEYGTAAWQATRRSYQPPGSRRTP